MFPILNFQYPIQNIQQLYTHTHTRYIQVFMIALTIVLFLNAVKIEMIFNHWKRLQSEFALEVIFRFRCRPTVKSLRLIPDFKCATIILGQVVQLTKYGRKGDFRWNLHPFSKSSFTLRIKFGSLPTSDLVRVE